MVMVYSPKMNDDLKDFVSNYKKDNKKEAKAKE